ncbi:MAG TPA: xylulokinase [Atribacteraceae bacterium]|nr:xylulokinase [Atribacteraceae bacterium]
MPKSYILGIDLGTSSLKATVLDVESGQTQTVSVDLTVSYPDSFSAEQDPRDWWNAFRAAVGKLPNIIGDLRQIRAVGLSGQMLGLVLLDRLGEAVRPCLIWCDQRSYTEVEELKEQPGIDFLLEHTANTPLTGYWLPKIMWLRKHEPETLLKTYKILLPKDYLRLRLTGEYVAEVSDASLTLLFDVGKRCWSPEVLRLINLDPALLPSVVESPEVTGVVTTRASAETGLSAGIPVVGGGGDQSSGGIGLGTIRDGMISCVLGTSGVAMALTHEAKQDHLNRGLHSCCYSMPGTWFVMGCTLAAGGSYHWFHDALVPIHPGLTYDQLNRLAGETPPGSGGLLYLPYLIGERTPHSDPSARGAFFGLNYQHHAGHLARAVLEGVAFSQRESVEILESFDLRAEQMVLAGGGARSPLWCQIMADIVNRAVITTNIDDPASLGAGIIAAVGIGMFASFEEACRKFIEHRNSYSPRQEHRERYEVFYEKYRQLYQTLKNFSKEFAPLQEKWGR